MADPERFDADPDPDPDPTFQADADPDPDPHKNVLDPPHCSILFVCC